MEKFLFIYSYNFRFFCGIPVTDNYGIRQAKAIIPMEDEINPIKMEFLNCIGVENNLATIFIGIVAVLLGVMGFYYLYSGEKTDFYHSLPLKKRGTFCYSFF